MFVTLKMSRFSPSTHRRWRRLSQLKPYFAEEDGGGSVVPH